MRYAILVLSVIALLAFACDDGEDGATATPTSTALEATATATVEPETGGIEGFRAFARQIEQALSNKDTGFFTERALLLEQHCTGTPSALGGLPCDDEAAGVNLRGIPGVPWQSDGFTVYAEEAEYAEWLQRYFSAALDDASDEYGRGALTLAALAQSRWLNIAVFDDAQEGAFGAVVSIIANPDRRLAGPSDPSLGDAARRYSRVFSFRFQDGRWRYLGEMNGGTASDWLSEECPACEYDLWERWEGGSTGVTGAFEAPVLAAATAVAQASGLDTSDKAVEAFAEAWQTSPFLGDCGSTAEQPGTCFTTREAGDAEATYTVCENHSDNCLIVIFSRGTDGSWSVSSARANNEEGEGPEILP